MTRSKGTNEVVEKHRGLKKSLLLPEVPDSKVVVYKKEVIEILDDDDEYSDDEEVLDLMEKAYDNVWYLDGYVSLDLFRKITSVFA